ncbi:MAG: hypothetical protein JSR91_14015 [Proteobacteria bacterium]|nr:hypothetical protein [Pseudomonadota bacterium]
MNDYSEEINQFNECVEAQRKFLSIVRDSGLQRDALAELSAMGTKVHEWKIQAISAQNENSANLFLGCECVIEALQAELKMWLYLKDDEPDKAWDCLVDAQMATSNAICAHEGFSHLEARAVQLVNIERIVFPKQVFFSTGLIVRRQQCSI